MINIIKELIYKIDLRYIDIFNEFVYNYNCIVILYN
jgi:hypothetical protein